MTSYGSLQTSLDTTSALVNTKVFNILSSRMTGIDLLVHQTRVKSLESDVPRNDGNKYPEHDPHDAVGQSQGTNDDQSFVELTQSGLVCSNRRRLIDQVAHTVETVESHLSVSSSKSGQQRTHRAVFEERDARTMKAAFLMAPEMACPLK